MAHTEIFLILNPKKKSNIPDIVIHKKNVKWSGNRDDLSIKDLAFLKENFYISMTLVVYISSPSISLWSPDTS